MEMSCSLAAKARLYTAAFNLTTDNEESEAYDRPQRPGGRETLLFGTQITEIDADCKRKQERRKAYCSLSKNPPNIVRKGYNYASSGIDLCLVT
jgi:hypothetical protein